ncbi:MAG TPA: TetR/AcrR family transcriptional regulator [Steroidobacteraceae bacterium]|nr:TetR/AcrR family transcriptional regulator [Steroidobacteraceae bacterium]
MSQAVPTSGLRKPLPTKQARSRKTRDALIAATWKQLQKHPWQDIAINDVVKAAGCSVGAFYARFSDKEALLEALSAEWLEMRRNERARGFASLAADADYAAFAIMNTYQHLMHYQNFWRAALVKGATDPVYWAPFRELGTQTVQMTIERHEQHIGRKLSEAESKRIRFAFQMANGAINNGIVNRPGPLMPGTAEFEEALIGGFKAVAGFT